VAKHIFLVFTDPVAGRDSEYNDWYSHRHVEDVLAMPGFVAAQRFKLAENSEKNLPGSYLAIYEMETDDPAAAVATLSAAAQEGRMFVSSALDAAKAITATFTPITDRVHLSK
jgi:hypothetical protein